MALPAGRATAPAVAQTATFPAALLALSVAFVFAVAIGLFLYTCLIADDFVRAVEGRTHGIIGGVWIEYTTWSCRWAAGFVHFVIAALVPLTCFYDASLMAITLVSLAMLSPFIAGLLGLRWRLRATALVVAVFAALWWTESPSVNELFFFRAAEVEYQLGWSAATPSPLAVSIWRRRPVLDQPLDRPVLRSDGDSRRRTRRRPLNTARRRPFEPNR